MSRLINKYGVMFNYQYLSDEKDSIKSKTIFRVVCFKDLTNV